MKAAAATAASLLPKSFVRSWRQVRCLSLSFRSWRKRTMGVPRFWWGSSNCIFECNQNKNKTINQQNKWQNGNDFACETNIFIFNIQLAYPNVCPAIQMRREVNWMWIHCCMFEPCELSWSFVSCKKFVR